ncbi:MAG TPA: polysaccharide biosynthesis tyrosine autokinase [Casimicrobiaceae bacterium]|nr:polysaccharide biosynthesis tyrosine autokinase [Casimicrobiaceae bacterium]
MSDHEPRAGRPAAAGDANERAAGPDTLRVLRPAEVRPPARPVDAGDDDADAAPGRYAGTQRVDEDFVPPAHRYRFGPQAAAPADETPEYLEYWRAIMLRKWSILLFALLGAALAAVVVMRMTPVYRSSATLLIETDVAKLAPVADLATGIGAYYREYFQTQAEVLRSRDIAQRVIARLGLDTHPEFDPRQRQPSAMPGWLAAPLSTARAWFDATLGPYLRPEGAQAPRAGAADAGVSVEVLRRFADGLVVAPVRQSQLIRVSFDAHDPALAAAIANATAQAYIQADVEARAAVSESTGEQINQRLEELRATLNASERALQAYRDREGMLDNKSTALGGTVRQLDEITQKLVDARVRRTEAEQAYHQVRTGEATNYESVPAVVKSAAIQRAKEVEADAEKKLAEVSQRYGPDHPRYAAAQSDLVAARANTRRQVQNLVASIVKEYEAARATEKSLEDGLAQAKGAIQSLNRKEIQLGALEREAATNRQIYQAFLSRSRETTAAKNVQASHARLVEQAVPALLPVRPKKTLTVTLAGVGSLLLALIVAVIVYRLNNTVQTSEDVERKLGRRLLSTLPYIPRRHRDRRGQLVLDHPHGLYAESVRGASTEVLLATMNAPRKVLAVTSSLLDEGKSTFAVNLAHVQARSRNVLLVEGDMRRPSFGKLMKLPPGQKGLADALAGTAPLEDCVALVEGTSLHVIPAGRCPQHPQELLLAPAFATLMDTLRSRYDTVVVDCPPVQLVADALVIGAQASGVIFVVRANETPVPMARKALKRVASAGIPIVGVVLNRQHVKRAEKYYGEYSGYGKYWYGAGYGTKP